ncbi:MAG: adenylate/guanylate cyclase domain-containing protein [Desulfuromonadales bacterium]
MFLHFLTKAFALISRYAAIHDDSDEWRLKKCIGVTSALIGVLTYLVYGMLYVYFNELAAGLVCIGACLLTIVTLLSYRIFRCYAVHWYFWVIIFTLTITINHIILGGFTLSGMVIIWLLFIPVNTSVTYKPRHGLVFFMIVAVIFLLAAFLQPYYQRTTNNIPSIFITALYVINTLGVATFILIGVYYYVWQNEVLKNKTEALLLNILPKEIAATLKNENIIIAEHFDSVSILFADIVNFTTMSTKMTPSELVLFLNEVFSYFDSLVDKYNLEKIKTIGDCYMVAAGVPRPRSDHAHILAQLALDIRDYVGRNEFLGKHFALRIGLNSGSVVAGVIGHKKFSYDLWGDTVNTASRMESHGAVNGIQIAATTYELIKDDFICEPRGVVNVKGKGEMNVWYVLGRNKA